MLISEEENDRGYAEGFYLRRVFRIVPALCVNLLTCGVLLAIGYIRDRAIAFYWAAFFLFDLSRVPMSWFFGHTWSLAIEEQFYIVFPSLWVLVRKQWRPWFFLALFFVCVLWNIEAVASSPHVVLVATGPPGFAGICCGVLMAIHEKRARRYAKLIPAFVVVLAGGMLILRPITSFDWRSAVYDSLVVPTVIALVLLFSMERGEVLRHFLRSRVMQALGVTSYGIYLWQQLFTAPVNEYSARGLPIAYLWPAAILIVASSYWLIERPAIRYGHALSRQAKQESAGKRPQSPTIEVAEFGPEVADL